MLSVFCSELATVVQVFYFLFFIMEHSRGKGDRKVRLLFSPIIVQQF